MTTFASSYDTNSSRGILKEDLANRVVFDREEVLEKVFGIFAVSDDTVNRLVADLMTTHRSQFDDLKEAVLVAEEKEMYSPLVS
jgi:hypothetical protein